MPASANLLASFSLSDRPATCGASPAKFCCLVVNALAASCLALKSAADSPACCEIPAKPVDTTGTPDCATPCCARSTP